MPIEFDPTFGVFVHDGIIEPCSHRERDPNCIACCMAGDTIAEAHHWLSLKAKHERKQGSFMDYEDCGEGS